MGLSLVNLGLRFGGLQALTSINAVIPASGLVAFIGPNGAGKSTLLDILSGFLAPTQGCVEDSNGGKLKTYDLLARFARLHQRLVVPDLPVEQFLRVADAPHRAKWLRCGRRNALASYPLHPEKLARLAPFLAHVGVTADQQTALQTLSYGQRRAVAAAAAILAPKPDLLLDEPFAGFAHGARAALVELLALEKRSRLILVCEHDLENVIKIADRIFVLVAGKLVANYLPEQMKLHTMLGHFAPP